MYYNAPHMKWNTLRVYKETPYTFINFTASAILRYYNASQHHCWYEMKAKATYARYLFCIHLASYYISPSYCKYSQFFVYMRDLPFQCHITNIIWLLVVDCINVYYFYYLWIEIIYFIGPRAHSQHMWRNWWRPRV